MSCLFFFERYGDHRDLHVLTHSCPTRRSSDLLIEAAVQQLVDGRLHLLGGVEDGHGLGAGGRKSRRHTKRARPRAHLATRTPTPLYGRSEEHTSELQSLMRISYAVFCLNKKRTTHPYPLHPHLLYHP